MPVTFDALRDDYAKRWADMAVRPAWKAPASAAAKRILDVRDRYEAVSVTSTVPWFVIGIIHTMECGGSFRGHLHNGDSLAARTWQVPAGRPVKGRPPFTWEESALDALRYDGLDKIADWSPERLAWCLEKFNGFGSRNRGVPSAYLWSGTDQYTRGKYVRDGVWSATAVSEQVGGMAILKALMDEDAGVRFGEDGLAAAAAAFPKAEKTTVADEAHEATHKPDHLVIPAADPPKTEGVGYWDGSSFAKVNDLAEQGSRLASKIRDFKAWFWRGATVAVGGGGAASQLVDTSKGTGGAMTQLASAHPFLFAGGCVALVAILAYVGVLLIQRGLLSAHEAGRYSPRGA